jgi:hypothetical protein
VSQGAQSAVDTALLVGQVGGAVALDSLAGNRIANLGSFNAGGAFGLQDTSALAIVGSVSAASVALTSQRSIAVAAGTTVTATGASGAVGLTAGTFIALGGTLAATGPDASVGLLAQNGGITATGIIDATSLSGSATGTVTLDATAGGGNQIAGLGAFSTTAGSFTLIDGASLAVSGPLVTAPQIVLTSAGSISQTGGTVATSDSNGSVALTAAENITLGGAVSATGSGATVTLTAANGNITESTGTIAATLLTASAPGSILLDTAAGGSNRIAQLGGIAAGGSFGLVNGQDVVLTGGISAASAVTLTTLAGGSISLDTPIQAGSINFGAAANLSVGGALTAGSITLTAGAATILAGSLSASTIDVISPAIILNGGVIDTGLTARSGAVAAANFPPIGAAGAFFAATSVTQTGTTTIAPNSTVLIAIAQNGAASLNNFSAAGTQLFLALGGGSAQGSIDVRSLYLSYSGGSGSAALFGEVGGVGGEAAAANAFIASGFLAVAHNSRYRINGCAVGSVNCVVVSPEMIPVTNPIQDILIGNTQSADDDLDLILPNVAERDY